MPLTIKSGMNMSGCTPVSFCVNTFFLLFQAFADIDLPSPLKVKIFPAKCKLMMTTVMELTVLKPLVGELWCRQRCRTNHTLFKFIVWQFCLVLNFKIADFSSFPRYVILKNYIVIESSFIV